MVASFLRDRATLFWLACLIALVVASATRAWPAPLGIVFLGAVIGALISFISIGLVLIYRTNRIINFAQADIGGVAAVLTVLLVAQTKMNYFLGVAIGIATAMALGALIELTVVRRFFKAPRLILTVATIAVTQVLVFIELILPGAFGLDFLTVEIPTPFDAQFQVPDVATGLPAVIFSANHILAIVSVPLLIGAIALFLKYTRMGIASRAAAENQERASLLGIPVRRISTIVWIVAAALSAVGALLRAPTIGLSIAGGNFGPSLLVRALAPAIVGRMENMRVTFVSSVVLGIIDQAVFFRVADPSIRDVILLAVIFGALLLARRDRAGRSEEVEESTWQQLREVRPVPRELRALPEVRFGFRAIAVALFGLLALFGLVGPSFRVGQVALILILAMIGVSLVVLTGWAGQISLGQMGFAGVGAAVAAALIVKQGVAVPLALLAAGLVGAAVAVVVGLPALRVKGLFLAVSTLAFGLLVATVVLNQNYFGWLLPRERIERPSVFGFEVVSDRAFFFFVLVVFTLILISARSLRRSRLGRVLIAARDNEQAVRGYGVNVTRARLAAFSFSGFYAAVAGGLFALHQNAVSATTFNVEASLQVFVMVVIGGLGSIPGALLGAAYYFSVIFFLPPVYSLLGTGLGMVVLLMVVPGGLGQVAYGWRDSILRWVAKRRGLVVPSLVADVRVDDSVLIPGSPAAESREPVATRTADSG
ncbi:MAG TPA: ABC transporter permease [Actinomycetota bacterium]|nr:ABC transporter permease [Actinomycetota bacterium]